MKINAIDLLVVKIFLCLFFSSSVQALDIGPPVTASLLSKENKKVNTYNFSTDLKVLDISFCKCFSSDDIENMLAALPYNVEELYLTNTKLTDRCLRIIATLKNIKVLDISFCFSITSKGIEEMLLHLSRDIKKLYMGRIKLTDKCLKILPAFTHLKALDISYCHNLNPEVVEEMLLYLTKGVEVLLLGYVPVTFQSLRRISQLHSLKLLEIGCSSARQSFILEKVLSVLPQRLMIILSARRKMVHATDFNFVPDDEIGVTSCFCTIS